MRAALLLPLLLLAGCGTAMSDAEKKAKEEADVQFVENLEPKNPPPEPINPLAIGYPDIERYKLFGATCAFAPGDSIGAIVLAMDETAWLKLEGKMVRLASDPGSTKRPFGTWSDYDGKRYALHIEMGSAGKQTASEAMTYRGSITIKDEFGQLVYSSNGTIQCSA